MNHTSQNIRTAKCASAVAAFAALLATTGPFARASDAAMMTIPATAKTPALPAHLARPAATAAAPAVVVLHGCEGYRTRYGEIADDLAKAGFVAIAIDTLTPRGVTNSCEDRTGSSIEAADARATLAWLRKQPFVDPQKLAVVGYSMGAIAALDLADPFHTRAAPTGLRGAVAYYPACRKRDARNAVVPIRIFDGSADDWTPAAPCAALAAAAPAAGASIAITTYQGATHAFNVALPDRNAYGHPLRYDPAATAQARAQMLTFLRAQFSN